MTQDTHTEQVERSLHAEMLAMEREDGNEGCSFDELDDGQRAAINRLARAAIEARTLPPTGEEMVERVARAMADDLSKRHYGIDRGSEDTWEAQTNYGRDEWRHAARAAIAALSASRGGDPV